MGKYAIGIYVGGTNSKIGLFDSEMHPLNVINTLTDKELEADQLLDILANDFKVDWWDANYTLEEKRRTLKDSWNVHRRLGTKAAVVLAISAIYPDTQVSEWWEYGGKPYHFKLLIDATYGRKTASVLIMDSDHVVLSALSTEKLAPRLGMTPEEIREEEE